jgi:hypothetical protein
MKITEYLKKLDIAAILLVLVLALAAGMPLFMRIAGDVVTVTAGGERYALSFADGVHTIEAGGFTLVLEVAHGAARVVASDCPDGLCMAMPAISRGGGTIVCVPAEVVILAGASEGGLDGVAG